MLLLLLINICSASPQTFINSPSLLSSPSLAAGQFVSSSGLLSHPSLSTGKLFPSPVAVAAPPAIVHQQVAAAHCHTEDEVIQAQICVPAFESSCSKEPRTVKVVTEKDQCQDITTPVCTESSEVVEKEICTATYTTKKQPAQVQSAEVTVTQNCQTSYSTVCQATSAYGYHNYGPHKYCKDVPQQTCYQVPQVSPTSQQTEVAAPEPATNCEKVSVSVPKVTCQDVVTTKCIKVPEVEEQQVQADKCEVNTSSTPQCKTINLSLPKTVCGYTG